MFKVAPVLLVIIAIKHVHCQHMHKVLDMSRLTQLRTASLETLKDRVLLETFIPKLGMNDEQIHEMPSIVSNNAGGIRLFQYPNQIAPYLVFLSKLSITSYLEIGCRFGGNFMLTSEYLSRFNKVVKSVAVDLHTSPVKKYTTNHTGFEFLKMNSRSESFANFAAQNWFDLIFIDGDHSYQGVRDDFNAVKRSSRIFVFHDITSTPCPGVAKFWAELKATGEYDTHEFTEQYPEVTKRTGGKKYLGIGVAIKRP